MKPLLLLSAAALSPLLVLLVLWLREKFTLGLRRWRQRRSRRALNRIIHANVSRFAGPGRTLTVRRIF